MHVPTYVATNVSLGFSSALSTVSASTASTDPTALAQQISKIQKDLASLLKRQRGTTPGVPPATVPPPAGGSVLKYCHKHGYQKTHTCATCKVMTGNPTLYTAQHLSAKDPLTPPGGNTAIRGCRFGQRIGTRQRIENNDKLAITLLNVNENTISNHTLSSTSMPMPVAPDTIIKIHRYISCQTRQLCLNCRLCN